MKRGEIMPKLEPDTLQKILERLTNIDPPIKKFPVAPPDPDMGIYFVDLKDVCYITTKSDQGREETMFMTSAKEAFYSNLGLSEIEKKLIEHPHFMRTSKYFLINLTKIRALKVSSSRDLWFDGLEKPVVNAVTSTYLAVFEKRFQ
jgi:DNA-binding LytR/AlgR family response regulator